MNNSEALDPLPSAGGYCSFAVFFAKYESKSTFARHILYRIQAASVLNLSLFVVSF